MVNRKIIIALIMSFLIVSTIIFSYSFFIKRAHHDCTGEGCPICMEIGIAVQTLADLKLMVSIVPFVTAFLCVFMLYYIVYSIKISTRDTLITLKVELLD